jgi:hypothetical protein
MLYFALSYCISHFMTCMALDAITSRKVTHV